MRNREVNLSDVYKSEFQRFGGMYEDENFIVVEVFYQFAPIVGKNIFGYLPAQLMKRQDFFSPRKGKLLVLPPVFPLSN